MHITRNQNKRFSSAAIALLLTLTMAFSMFSGLSVTAYANEGGVDSTDTTIVLADPEDTGSPDTSIVLADPEESDPTVDGEVNPDNTNPAAEGEGGENTEVDNTIAVNTTSVEIETFGAGATELAKWPSTTTGTATSVTAGSGIYASDSSLAISSGGTFNTTFTAPGSFWYTNDGTTSWQFKLKTTGYENIHISFGTYGTAPSAKNWEVKYSTDNITYYSFSPAKTYNTTATAIASADTQSFDLPAIAADQSELYIRLVPESSVVSGNTRLVLPIVVTGDIDPNYVPPPSDPEVTGMSANPETLLETGGQSTITVAGTDLEDGITVTAFNSLDAPTSVTGTTTGSETSQTVQLTFPENTTTSDVAYTVKASLDGGNAWEVATAGVTVAAPSADPDYTSSGDEEIISQWNVFYASADLDTDNKIPNPAPTEYKGTSGIYKEDSELSYYRNTGSGIAKIAYPKYQSGGLTIGTIANMANNAYHYVKTKTTDLTNISFSLDLRSTNTGPRHYKVHVSTDETNWIEVGNIDVNPASTMLTFAFTPDAAIQKRISNKDELFIRFMVSTNISANTNGASIGANTNENNNQINNVIVKGEYIDFPDQTKPVKAYISGEATTGGEVPVGTVVDFSSATAGANIYYSTDDGSSYTQGSTVTLNSLPVTVYAYAEDGSSVLNDSRVTKFTFTQAKLGNVSAFPSGGSAVRPGTEIVLTSAQPGAKIYYILTKNSGTPGAVTLAEALYSAPIMLTEDMLPVSIAARSTLAGYEDSNSITFNYTLKSAGGGEKNYYGQLHSHTTNSDGAGSLEEAYEYARDTAGLDFFAVTDHSNSYDTKPASDTAATYNLGGYNADNPAWIAGQTAARNALTSSFVSVYGFEMTWSGGPGHINTFNTEGFVSRNNTALNNKTNDSGMRAYYTLLKNTPDSISQFNHPGTTFGNFSNFAYYDPDIDKQITLVEVGNGEGTIGSGGYFPSYEQYTMALDRGWHVAPTNNQDNHKKGWGTSNTCRTVIWTNDFSVGGLYTALREMRVYATEVADLDITYSMNGEPLGEILDYVPSTAVFTASIKNPTAENTVKSVSLITNGGKEIGKKTFNTQNADYTFTLQNPDAGYYYLRVVDVVGGKERYAVTAPVWMGEALAMGVTDVKKDAALPVTTEELTLTTNLFNNEISAATLTSITYTDRNGNVLFSETPNTTIPAGGSINHSMKYTPQASGDETIKVTALIEYEGVVREYTGELSFNIIDINTVHFIGIDGSHYNEYVSGNYKDNMTNFSKLASDYNVRTAIYNTSAELIAACSNPQVKALIITAPSRRLNPAGSKFYTQDEIDAVAAFAKAGGTVIIAGWSDTYETYANVPSGLESHMAGQQNKLLEAIGSSLRLGDDSSVDEILNPSPNQYRLYLKDTYNRDNSLTAGIVPEQEYSVYGGNTVYAVNPDGSPALTLPANVSPIINGLNTTWSMDRDGDGYGLADSTQKLPRYGDSSDVGRGEGVVLLNASEIVDHGGTTSLVIATGGAFMSNFEIQVDMDNADTLPYSNYTILSNVIESVAPEVIVTSIADAKLLPEGTSVTIEGIATSSVNEGSTSTNKGFFDCIYVQDETAGINLFPVSDGVQEGQMIRVTGRLSSYQGETQIAVSKVIVLDPIINSVAPTVLSTGQAMHESNTGLLIKTKGVVSNVIKDENGVNQFTINDGSGPALIYINGYITPGTPTPFVTEGAYVSVIGLASVGENYSDSDFLPRIRVRDRSEIALAQPDSQPSSDSSSSKSSSSSSSTPAARVEPKPLDQASGISEASKAASGDGVVKLKNVSVIKLDVIKAMANAAKGRTLKVSADSMSEDGKAVDVRISFNPLDATSDINAYGSTYSVTASSRKMMFEKWFSNKVAVISLGQNGSFGMSVKIAAKPNLSGMDAQNLHFYAYNSETNKYTKIKNPGYWIDKNGYIQFYTEIGGDIIISEGPLTRK